MRIDLSLADPANDRGSLNASRTRGERLGSSTGLTIPFISGRQTETLQTVKSCALPSQTGSLSRRGPRGSRRRRTRTRGGIWVPHGLTANRARPEASLQRGLEEASVSCTDCQDQIFEKSVAAWEGVSEAMPEIREAADHSVDKQRSRISSDLPTRVGPMIDEVRCPQE